MLDSTYEKWLVPNHLDLAAVRFGGGDGLTLESAFIISMPVHLLKLHHDVMNGFSYSGTFFRFAADIDLGGLAWEPIGYMGGTFDKREFSGMIDGAGHTVGSFHVNAQDGKSAGFFGYLEYAVVQNLYIKDFVIANGDSVGGLAGYADTSTIASCYAEGRITSNSSNIGGLVGLASNCVIMNSASLVTINATDGNVAGGLCGYVYNGAKINNCESKGELRATNLAASGGFVGSLKDSTVENCHAHVALLTIDCGNIGGFGGIIRNCRLDWCTSSGSVSASNEETNATAGGFVGSTNSVLTRCIASGDASKGGEIGALGGFVGDVTRGAIYSSYSIGNVMGEGFVGGFAGVANCADDASTNIENCYCIGNITSNESKTMAGGFVGYMRRQGGNVIVSNCYSYGAISPKVKGFTSKESSGSIVDCVWHRDEGGVNTDGMDGRNIVSLSTKQFCDQDTFAGMGWNIYDLVGVWCYTDEIKPGRPHLNGLPVIKR
ncbi:MAG: hypothetical protein LBT23_02255 [Synergistaceae bacterium]|jgi:hypothetical protein|nr:hypothetical protein [Synergistaceae bacterium]